MAYLYSQVKVYSKSTYQKVLAQTSVLGKLSRVGISHSRNRVKWKFKSRKDTPSSSSSIGESSLTITGRSRAVGTNNRPLTFGTIGWSLIAASLGLASRAIGLPFEVLGRAIGPSLEVLGRAIGSLEVLRRAIGPSVLPSAG